MTRDHDARKPRIAEPQRRQGVIRFEMPEDTLPAGHRARVLWDVVGTLDLGKFLRGAKANKGTAGRKTLSPRMKLVLWLYAISTGVGSAREIARLVRSDDAYRWIVGDLAVGHDTLSSFRVAHGAALDELMTDILASLMHKGVLSLDLVAQDGIRIRAAATAPSFRRLPSLLECREQAALHLKAVLAHKHRARAHGSCGSKYEHEHEHEHESDWSAAAPFIDSSSVLKLNGLRSEQAGAGFEDQEIRPVFLPVPSRAPRP